MYDPLDFRHGIGVLQEAETLNEKESRKNVLEIMLADFEGMKGNLHHELMHYIEVLSLFPDDPVDFKKLHELHYELACWWGSDTNGLLGTEKSKFEAVLPMARRDKKRQDGTKKKRNPEITEWIRGAIKRYPDATRPELYKKAPDWITDNISKDRFLKRVSAARKM